MDQEPLRARVEHAFRVAEMISDDVESDIGAISADDKAAQLLQADLAALGTALRQALIEIATEIDKLASKSQ